MASKIYTKYQGISTPLIQGAGGGGKGGGSEPREDPNSLFSTDIMFIVAGLGEGPIYRVNPNGPQDIEIQDSAIDDLINLDGDGTTDTEKFVTLHNTGTTVQSRLDVFGETVVTPQSFVSPVDLKKGNLQGVPSSKVTEQETSAAAWDAIKFNFIIPTLQKITKQGDVLTHTVSIRVTVKKRVLTGNPLLDDIVAVDKTITGKTTTPFKFNMRVNIPEAYRDNAGYRFTIEKTSDDDDSSGTQEKIQAIGWDEIENAAQAYPRTAHIGYALKAVDEHTGGVPTFTSLVKGLLVKVPANYNQPILDDGQIDWRQVEVAASGIYQIGNGYKLQQSGTGTTLTDPNPNIYVGSWDGTFVYSWTQNPVWVLYDLLTNTTYGLAIPEANIDKYRFYQVAQYCDACDAITGNFIGVDGLADGTFRHKPRNQFTAIRQNQIGMPEGTSIKQRRFTMNIVISDTAAAMDTLNTIAASFRSALVYSHGKITLASDLPDELPVMVFGEATIKQGSFQISGNKESDILTGVEVSYIEPTNHYKREVVRVDHDGANSGVQQNMPENITTLDLAGVTRRSQALRFAQYQIAASKFLKRTINFSTSTDALSLVPGDVIAVQQNQGGIAYGFGGKIVENSSSTGANSNVFLEHYTVPSLANSTFTANTKPLALRVIKQKSDRVDLYLLSNTQFKLTSTDDVATGFDLAEVNPVGVFDPITKSFKSFVRFYANSAPEVGDLWTFGEIDSPDNFYTSKSDKLFKVTSLSRSPDNEEVDISAIEYISNVYVDSDTFIDYKPTAYTDIVSALSVPPAPQFDLIAQPRERVDGSIQIDGILNVETEKAGLGSRFSTEFFLSTPSGSSLVANVTQGTPTSIQVATANSIVEGVTPAVVTGKNGFTTRVGEIRMLCNAVTTVDATIGDPEGNIQLTLEGLNVAFDQNFFKHVLDTNDGGVFGNLKGQDFLSIPINEKSAVQGLLNFVGHAPRITEISREIQGHDKVTNTIKIRNTDTNGVNLENLLPPAPFYVSINQLLDSRHYANNSFYVGGSEFTYINEGELTSGVTNTIDLEVRPRKPAFARLFVDGDEKPSSGFTVNVNDGLSINANIEYVAQAHETAFRAEVDYYTVPVIEMGDNIQSSSGNVFAVANTSYDPESPTYNAALTANMIYRVETVTKPVSNLAGFTFVNISPDITGSINNVSGGSATFDYNKTTFPGNLRLANNRVYNIGVGSDFERFFLTKDGVISDLQVGTTTVRARNKTITGRSSPFNTKTVVVSTIPISKVKNLAIFESLYREQTGGVAVRATVVFDALEDQSVTDYEISYRLDQVEDVSGQDGGADLTSFNTVKVPASGVDSDGKIRFTVNGINRGINSETNSIFFRVVGLNKDIRGISAEISKNIVGKTAKPANIFNFTGGQQTDQVTLLWSYPRTADGELEDLDLKEVVIRRAPGDVAATVANFVASDPLVTVSAGTARKSIPIDTFGEFTYLARTRDTSGNFSDGVAKISFTTTRPARATVVAAYNEDSPSVQFAGITNTNDGESSYPSFADVAYGGLVRWSEDTTPPGAGNPSSATGNANASATGFAVVSGSPTDLIATGTGEYITQIRDFGSEVTGAILVEIEGSQAIETTYEIQHDDILTGVTEASPNDNVLHDVDFGGIGHVLGFSNASVVNVRFDANNQTLMSGGAAGNVYAIWNDGQFANDFTNSNSYALVAGVINANAIELGASYFANGEPTGTNALANITTSGNSYTLVDLTQYSDTGTGETFAGTLGAVSAQTLLRTTTADNTALYYANGNVDSSQFIGGAVNEGFQTYQAGSRTFRQFQLKFIVNNSKPNEFDFTIDKFRYTIEKDVVTFTDTITYSGEPTTVNYTSAGFLNRPVITYTVLTQEDAVANPAIVVTTAASSTTAQFRLVAADGTGSYLANSTATVMVTAQGV